MMRPGRALMLVTLVALGMGLALSPCAAGAAAAPRLGGSRLAYPRLSENGPPGLVAQRTIERHWGPSDDSTYREIDVKGWKSEGGAMAMSGILPGSGQVYAGARSGYLFLLGEAVGLYEVWFQHKRANDLEQQSRRYAGSPFDTTSRWSFVAYQKRTGKSTADLQAIFNADPALFYYLISRNDNLNSGWVDGLSGDATRTQFTAWREDGEAHGKRQRFFVAALLANHLISAVDAFRTARMVNLPLEYNLHLRMKGGLGGGSPSLMASLERRF